MDVVKIKPRITFKVTSTSGKGMNGIGDRYWKPMLEAGLPTGIMSVDATGPIVELIKLAQATPGYDLNQLYLHYRITGIHHNEGRFVDVPNYDQPPIQAAVDDYLYHHQEWRKKFGNDFEMVKRYCWFGINNEPDQTKSEWLAEYSLQQLKLAASDGIKLAVFAWSTGTPDYPAWDGPKMKELLAYLKTHRSTAAIDLHEYSLDEKEIDVPDLIGRWTRIEDLFHVSLIFSEWGWAERGMPERREAMRQIDDIYAAVMAYPNVIGYAGWTLDGSWGNLWQIWNSMFEDIVQFTNQNSWEDVIIDPGNGDEPVEKTNLIYNGDWTKGWTKVSASSLQMNGWRLEWDAGQISEVSGERYDFAEWTVKTKEQLPPGEWEYLNPASNATYKVFGGGVPFKSRMVQDNVKLDAGKKYTVIVRAVMDAYNVINGQRSYDTVDYQQTRFEIKVNDEIVATFLPADVGPDEVLMGPVPFMTEAVFVARDTNKIALRFQSEWGISCNYFIKSVELYEATQNDNPFPPTEPVKHKAIVVKLPQDMTKDDWLAAAEYAYQYRHTMTASHDDMLTILRGGNEDSSVKLVGGSFMQPMMPELIESEGYTWEPVLMPEQEEGFKFHVWPVLGYSRVTQEFGANPQNYAKFGFPGHEGVDFAAGLGTPIVAVDGGVVTEIDSKGSGNYGKFVRVRHRGDWETLYAHLDDIDVRLLQQVVAGSVLGGAGSTGNSTGVHLHLTLRRNNHTYTDANGITWPKNIFDPTPYLVVFQGVEWPGGSPGIPPVTPPKPLIDIAGGFPTNGPVVTLKHYGGPHNGHEEHVQHRGYKLIKDRNYEEVGVEDGYVIRRIDTSPTDSEWYILTEADRTHKWAPTNMEVGKDYVRTPLVRFYYKELVDGAVKESRPPYISKTYIRLARVLASFTTRLGQVIPGPVYVLEVRDYNGTLFERTFYAHGIGMIRWENVSEGWATESINIDWPGNLATPIDPPAVKQFKKEMGLV